MLVHVSQVYYFGASNYIVTTTCAAVHARASEMLRHHAPPPPPLELPTYIVPTTYLECADEIDTQSICGGFQSLT
jgi:hypothetical protein